MWHFHGDSSILSANHSAWVTLSPSRSTSWDWQLRWPRPKMVLFSPKKTTQRRGELREIQLMLAAKRKNT